MSLKKLKKYFTEEFWIKKQKKNPDHFLTRIFTTLILTVTDFIKQNCFEKAATLTFYSLLSIIPIIAIAFGIAQLLGWEAKLDDQIREQFTSQPEIADKIIEFSQSMLQRTRGGLIAAFGLAVLLWTAFRMIVNIGNYFDMIWNVKTPKTIWQQVKTYLPLIPLFPVFVIIAHSSIIFLSTLPYLRSSKIVGPLFEYFLQIFPFLLMAIALSFIYLWLPNRKVPWKAGIIAGVITALIYLAWQWVYINFQIKSASYGAIYGGFAAIPLFLLWLYYSWLIVLFGTVLSTHIEIKKIKELKKQ